MINKLLCFFIVLFLGVGTYYVLQNELHLTRRIRIEPNFAGVDPFYLPVQKDLKARLQSLQGHEFWHTSLGKIQSLIQEDSRVKSFNIQRRWPGHYVVQMAPYRPVALWLSPGGRVHPMSSQAQILRPTALHELPDVPVLRGLVFKTHQPARQKAALFLAELPRQGWLSMQRVLELQYDLQTGLILSLRIPGGGAAARASAARESAARASAARASAARESAARASATLAPVPDEASLLRHQLYGKVQKIKLGHSHYRQKIKRLEKVLEYLHASGLDNHFIDARFEKKVLVRLHQGPEAKGAYALK